MIHRPFPTPGRRGALGAMVALILLLAFTSASLPSAHAQGGPAALPSVTGTSFTSSFNGAHTGWSVVKGPWKDSAYYYTSAGLSAPYTTFNSIQHDGTYGNFVYAAKMKRTGSDTSSDSGLIVRGNASPLGGDGWWGNGYMFIYDLTGTVQIDKIVNGSTWPMYISSSTGRVYPSTWNVLKIVAYQTVLAFYMNGALLYTTTDSTLGSGVVGIIMSRYVASTNNMLWVDWAKLAVIPF